MNPRAKIYQETKPHKEVSVDDIVEHVRSDLQKVDPRFLRNQYLPIDPSLVAEKREAYLEELERWTELEEE